MIRYIGYSECILYCFVTAINKHGARERPKCTIYIYYEWSTAHSTIATTNGNFRCAMYSRVTMSKAYFFFSTLQSVKWLACIKHSIRLCELQTHGELNRLNAWACESQFQLDNRKCGCHPKRNSNDPVDFAKCSVVRLSLHVQIAMQT